MKSKRTATLNHKISEGSLGKTYIMIDHKRKRIFFIVRSVRLLFAKKIMIFLSYEQNFEHRGNLRYWP